MNGYARFDWTRFVYRLFSLDERCLIVLGVYTGRGMEVVGFYLLAGGFAVACEACFLSAWNPIRPVAIVVCYSLVQ